MRQRRSGGDAQTPADPRSRHTGLPARAPPETGWRRSRATGPDRTGQYSIRINAQWRVCFRFSAGISSDVEIVDYH
ncbi:MAG: type II toxin-antitoxin system RelE/ParE family toxin [Alcaligenaceae bacterium]|nr:type II toxin-antitoxin system RelE/ParE family toxin [Alcaligenaceae bacterium SAGV5]MPS52895.1 type II toxin-antitoxin system RelE/ParE family toxin [Alcaligenaceae bacterium SAGV3]MPT60290.1 type II toxin-antitoxin system RelE/ParE family toxin [Alcaligenaceae bacterium]